MESLEHNLDNIVKKNLNTDQLKTFNKLYYGREDHCELKLKDTTISASNKFNFQVAGYSFDAAKEEVRKPRKVKIGLIQHSIVLPTDQPIEDQREAILEKVQRIIEVAAAEGVKILCLQETWSMPFFLCTKEKEKWAGFAESPVDGPSSVLLSKLAKKYQMIIVSPILERDDDGVWGNVAVVFDDNGNIMGKHRKNHLPSIGGFSETSYYITDNLGHAVFETKYAKIAINICYGRHQAMNWMMFALNGADIVFNPAATVAEFGESFWGIEARNAAIANSYFTCGINRVGTEQFNENQVSRTYYGSSYVTAPNGVRTPGLSRVRDGILIAEIDLNLCRQVKDHWGFHMTGRLDAYAKELSEKVNAEKKTVGGPV
ncbi:carbon-nitrogen hydrolase domain-containing protein [Phthorimaea operculella]|nr:carbon-nitrogen hydrolase domain-containing protein [Phthorimaea operculella]